MAAKIEGYLNKDEDSEVKSFIGRTENILSQNSFAISEHHISEVLIHKDLLEGTVRSVEQLQAKNRVCDLPKNQLEDV